MIAPERPYSLWSNFAIIPFNKAGDCKDACISSIALCLYVLSVRPYTAPYPRPVLFILPYNPEQCYHTLCAHDRDKQTHEQSEATHACHFESVVPFGQVWYKSWRTDLKGGWQTWDFLIISCYHEQNRHPLQTVSDSSPVFFKVVDLLVSMCRSALESPRKVVIFEPYPSVVDPNDPQMLAFNPRVSGQPQPPSPELPRTRMETLVS